MLKPKVFKNFLFYSILSLSFIFCAPLFAEDKGQIININQSYQIAFTDLGNNVLKQGDIVKVVLGSDEFVYMQVLESSAILSKLGQSQSGDFQTSLKDFQNMTVGDEVYKVALNQEKTEIARPVNAEAKDAVELSERQIQKLEGDLALAKEEINRLEESNNESKAKLNELAAAPSQTVDKNLLQELKVHIDNMHKIIDGN